MWGKTPEQLLADRQVPQDFVCDLAGMAPLRYIHRHCDDGTDIYFVANKSRTAKKCRARSASPASGPSYGGPSRAESSRGGLPGKRRRYRGALAIGGGRIGVCRSSAPCPPTKRRSNSIRWFPSPATAAPVAHSRFGRWRRNTPS